MRKSHLHAYNASANISSASTILGIIGTAINPLLGIGGMLLGNIGQDRKIDREVQRVKKFYNITYSWERK